MNNVNQPLEPEEINFIYQVKKELSLANSHEAVSLIAPVLQAFRQTLSLQSAEKLLNNLPEFLRLMFVANWKQNEERVTVTHLDELVTLLMEREKASKKSFFKNEVQALYIVILTLKKLFAVINFNHVDGLSQAMRQELREVPTAA